MRRVKAAPGAWSDHAGHVLLVNRKVPKMSDSPAPDLAKDLQEERRLEDRQAVHWPMLLGWKTPAGPAYSHARTSNISFNGAHVAADRNLIVGEKVAWRLTVEPWHGNNEMFDIDGFAKVVHSAYSSKEDGFDVGLQFVDFSGDGKVRLAKVIHALQQSAVPAAGTKIIHGME
jgi:hypothetical protein